MTIPLALTLKIRLYPTSKQAKYMDSLCNSYSRACSYGSKRYFDAQKNLSVSKLHSMIYYQIKKLFSLKAQEADSVPKTIKSKYKAVNTQLYNNSHRRYKDVYTGKHFYIDKNVNDLWHFIHFKTPQADLVYKNDWRILLKQNKLSINTLTGHKRMKISFYTPKYFRKYLKRKHKLGTAKLIKKKKHYYLYVGCTIYVKDLNQISQLISTDRGIRFLDCPYNGHNFTHVVKGLSIRKKRTHFLHQRAILQHKNTRSAKRKLRQRSGKENCWMHTKNHQIVKALVSNKQGIVYVLENLRGVRFANKDVKRKYKYGQVSWAFHQFGNILDYKSKIYQSYVIHVPKQYTSQRCPKCGYVCAESRNHGKHVFICMNPNCNYRGNDDFTASKNIGFLGNLELLGYQKPTIQKNSKISYRHYYKYKGKRHYKLKHLSPKQAIKLVRTSHVTNQ